MTDIYDQATEIEDMHRRIALENQAARTAGMAAVSAYECEECGPPSGRARLPLLYRLPANRRA
mgnify:CR=1 FL=1